MKQKSVVVSSGTAAGDQLHAIEKNFSNAVKALNAKNKTKAVSELGLAQTALEKVNLPVSSDFKTIKSDLTSVITKINGTTDNRLHEYVGKVNDLFNRLKNVEQQMAN